MSFVCEKCEKQFTTKQSLTYHIDKKACKMINYHCKYCGNGFTLENSMYRHIKHVCKVKKQQDDEKNQIYEKLLKLEEDNKKMQQKFSSETEKLKAEVKQLKKASKTNKTNISNTVNGNANFGTVINNIMLVGYGKEDLTKLSKSEMLKILQNGFDSSLKLTEAVHFNPKYPEYHNIYISNIKDKYAMMYDGNTWTLTMKEELINKIYDDKKNYIEENLDDFIDSLPLSRKKALERWLELDDENAKIREIKEQIKLLLYNKRNMPIDQENQKGEIIFDDASNVVIKKKKPRKTIKDSS